MVWYLIESLFLEIHIRYIDSVHIAKNELQKNKNILKSYRDHLRQQKLEELQKSLDSRLLEQSRTQQLDDSVAPPEQVIDSQDLN